MISLSSAAFIPTSPESRIVATFEWKDAKDLKRKSTYFLSGIKKHGHYERKGWKWIWVSSCAYMNTAKSTTIEHILNLKITLWGSPSCAATRRVCKVRGIANPSENDFQWEPNSILANLFLDNIYVDKFRMVFVKTVDCTHVHNSVCMPELTVGCK